MENKAGEIEQVTVENEGDITSQTAGAEVVEGEKESLSLGKFSSVSDLLNAYNKGKVDFSGFNKYWDRTDVLPSM